MIRLTPVLFFWTTVLKKLPQDERVQMAYTNVLAAASAAWDPLFHR